MNTSLESLKTHVLLDRALMLKQARAFFYERNVTEVDSPALAQSACVDLHIDVMKVAMHKDQVGYLHTSPEYGMKRLLSFGIGDIFQISHVFRFGEVGPLHNPEFTMVEWYRLNLSFEELISETLSFISLFFSTLSAEILSYKEALLRYAGIDYQSAGIEDLLKCAKENHLDLPSDAVTWDKDTLLQLLMSFLIEPHLGKDRLTVIKNFPASQAALAKAMTTPDGEHVAMRFEVYYQGVELANGYDELTDADEQKLRFEASNLARAKAGKEMLKVDEKFIEALRTLPSCCGVAVGFDRLMLMRHEKKELKDVLPFTWDET